jgi:hypothetical protein
MYRQKNVGITDDKQTKKIWETTLNILALGLRIALPVEPNAICFDRTYSLRTRTDPVPAKQCFVK